MNRLTKKIASLLLLLLVAGISVAQAPVEVEIQSVDTRNKSLSVTHNGKTLKLAIAPNIAITVEGNKSDLASLLPGDTASLIYDKDIAAVTSIAAQHALIAPAEKLAEGWDKMDDRLIFLMVRLASTEASLEAIDNAIALSGKYQSRKTVQAKQSEKKNDVMDRNGGGPVKWSSFYGRTAESFFYHPTDRNTTYHTTTILSQQAPINDNQASAGVPSRQGLPVHQRPPQFDYLYRANESAKARAEKEVSELKGRIEPLFERKRNLESEQAGLWCEIAFRAVSHYDLDKKPLYRFEPLQSDTTSGSQQNAALTTAASKFMRISLAIVSSAQQDQAATFPSIKLAIAEGRTSFDDTLLRLGLDRSDMQSAIGRFAALAKRLEDVASNLSDSFVVANEGDRAQDESRKQTFRGLLQESLVRYAEIILAMDEMSTIMRDDWGIKPDLNKPLALVSISRSLASSQPTFSSGLKLEALRIEASSKPAIGRSIPSKNDGNTVDDKRTTIITNLGTFKSYWKNGDDRGNFWYDDKTNAIVIDSPYSLGTLSVNEPWNEFYFEIAAKSLSFDDLDIQINGVTFKVGPAVKKFPNGIPVRIVFDEEKSQAMAIVGRDVVSQATISNDKWTTTFKCHFSSGGGQNAQIRLSNIQLRRLKTK